MIYSIIYLQPLLNKCVLPNKRARKEKARVKRCTITFSFHQPLCIVGCLLRYYIIINQYFTVHIQQFNKILKFLQQFSRDGIIPAYTSSGLVTVHATVLVGGISKTVGRRCQLPAFLHHFPNLRLLHLDLRADEQGNDVIQAERHCFHFHFRHDVKQQFRHFYFQSVAVASDYLPQGFSLQQLRVKSHAALLFGGEFAFCQKVQESWDFRFQLL